MILKTCGGKVVKKGFIILPVVLLVALSGCGKKRHKAEKHPKKPEISTSIDIPVAEDGIKSFFDEDINEFALADEVKDTKTINTNIDVSEAQAEQYAWVEDQADGFKVVLFDFDSYSIRADQEENLKFNIELAKQKLAENTVGNEPAVLVIDGHACHSAGSRVYNLALSEKRAKVLADKFIEAGIAPESIKIVGRGSEVPAIVDGKPCDGSREQQWPNRRDELHIFVDNDHHARA